MEIVIPSSDLIRINAYQAVSSQDRNSHSAKNGVSKVSQNRSAQMKNTQCFRRSLKEKERCELELEKEKAQIEIDDAEDLYQAKKKSDIIEKANFMISQENERMRVFNSAMMLSDVLAERDNQIKIKEELDRLNLVRERRYDEMGKHNNERMLQREETEQKERSKKKLEVARVQREQLKEAVDHRRAEIEADKREGFLMRMEYQKQLQDDELDAKALKGREIRAMRECQRAQEYLKELKAREKTTSALMEQKILEHAKKQEDIQLKRKQRENFVFEQKQKVRQDMIDRQAAKLAEIRDQADERIQQQCKDAIETQDKIEFERKEYLNQRLLDVQIDRRDAIQRKERLLAEGIAIEKQAAGYMNLLQAKFKEEDARAKSTRERVKFQTSEQLLAQIRAKQNLLHHENMKVANARDEAAKIERTKYDGFQHYAEGIIREYAECGRNIMPMINIIKGS